MNGEILNAVMVLGGLGIFCGVLLGLVSHYFGVEEDPRVAGVLELLPGANCGACGFAGCADFARAIVTQGAPVNQCAPGGNAVAGAVAAFLGVKAELCERKTAIVLCKGGHKEARRKFAYNGVADCAAAVLVAGGDKACAYGCLGLGSCARACPVNAIEITDNGLAVVHAELCIGCGKCVAACPRQLIQLVPESAEYHVLCSSKDRGPVVRKVCTAGCIGCTLCAKAAPESLKMEGALAVMDYTKPLADPVVAAKCPQKTIVQRSGCREEASICA
ncbi:MAG: RnfABCDGE type electron transport complex subunit B [Kiritimatiellia bacterium]|jgi:electron transport complex protein RnfB